MILYLQHYSPVEARMIIDLLILPKQIKTHYIQINNALYITIINILY